MTDLFADIAALNAWLDRSNPASQHEDAMRLFKIMEEAGEVAEAYIGMVGQNPRKGVTHTLDDVLGELADVVMTALCAIQHFTQDVSATERIVTEKAAKTRTRAGL
jgi:NTP pyrophosphatase (non-canonical NTP hydrolase)